MNSGPGTIRWPPSEMEVKAAVEEYDSRPKWGGADEQLFRKATQARELLREPEFQRERLGDFIWDVWRWGKIRGVSGPGRDDATLAQAVWAVRVEINEIQPPHRDFSKEGIRRTVHLVEKVVKDSEPGLESAQWSWSSKILHWLAPHQVPIYDRLVRDTLASGRTGREAYEAIVSREFEWARSFTRSQGKAVGKSEPATLLRALDKYLWLKRYQANHSGRVRK